MFLNRYLPRRKILRLATLAAGASLLPSACRAINPTNSNTNPKEIFSPITPRHVVLLDGVEAFVNGGPAAGKKGCAKSLLSRWKSLCFLREKHLIKTILGLPMVLIYLVCVWAKKF
jgi:hypothetical protein